jgi:hypothetical protein
MFGQQTITTKVKMMIPKDEPTEYVDVTSAMYEPSISQGMEDSLLENLNLLQEEK